MAKKVLESSGILDLEFKLNSIFALEIPCVRINCFFYKTVYVCTQNISNTRNNGKLNLEESPRGPDCNVTWRPKSLNGFLLNFYQVNSSKGTFWGQTYLILLFNLMYIVAQAINLATGHFSLSRQPDIQLKKEKI